MVKRALVLGVVFLLLSLTVSSNGEEWPSFGPLVRRESRRTLVSTESGIITAVDVHDGQRGSYHLQFISLEPGSLFLPVLLHTDMVFYIHTGRGTMTYIDGNGSKSIDLERGDVYRLEDGSVFYVQSQLDPTRERLRIYAIFNIVNIENPSGSCVGAYSNVSDLIRGFDDRVLQMGFGVSEETIKGIKGVKQSPSIVPFTWKSKKEKPNWKEGILEALIGVRGPTRYMNSKKKTKKSTFNVFSASPDVKNCNGWSIAVTMRDLRALRGSDMGVFMVNLTKGAMMGPHWNPKATEIGIVIHGEGMVQVVCPSDLSRKVGDAFKCRNMKFRVNEGDIFVVPRYHPMAQISFNNDSFVFMGFSTNATMNHPQFLAGRRSVLQTIDKEILAVSFNAPNTTIEDLLGAQDESIMLECTSCAEELEEKMEEEIERQRQEEERSKEEEEERRREEEEAKRREEEEARKKEEEEARRREEEEARRREEEEARRREEEKAKRREEEEARKRQEEEAARREEEESSRREEKEARKKEEEAGRREEEEARKREEEKARWEEEEARKREEEKARREEEEARRGEEEQAREEEAMRREDEEARRKKEKEVRKQEEARREEAITEKKEKEEESRKEEQEATRREEKRQEVEVAEKKREEAETTKRGEEEEEARPREEEQPTRMGR